MKLKRHIEFIKENVDVHIGDFKVTHDMVNNGKMIEDMIPREVTGSFHCSNNPLQSLEGIPKNFSSILFVDNSLKTEKIL